VIAIIAMGAMVVRANRRLVHPGHEGRPAGAAHRRRSEDAREAHAFAREPVEIRRLHEFLAVASEVWRKILADQPEDVGFARYGVKQDRRHET
jgi:hypothetical protein